MHSMRGHIRAIRRQDWQEGLLTVMARYYINVSKVLIQREEKIYLIRACYFVTNHLEGFESVKRL